MPLTNKSTADQIRKRGYSPKEVATATGLSLASINRGIADGSIPSTKFKDRRIISDSTIDALIDPKPATRSS
jgi:hypothetical protein